MAVSGTDRLQLVDHACRGCGTSFGWREHIDRNELLFRLRAAGSLINSDVAFALRRAIGALIGCVDDPEVSRAFLAIMSGKQPDDPSKKQEASRG